MSVTLPGTGKNVATEIVGGEHFQQVKLIQGDAASAAPITKTNPLPVSQSPAASSSVVGVDLNTAAVNLLVANSSRRGALIFNNADKDLCVKLGSAVTTSLFSVKLVPGAYFEVPAWYSGLITGIWTASGTGKALVTEIS